MKADARGLPYGTASGGLPGGGLLLPPPRQCTTHAHEHAKQRLVATTAYCTISSHSAASYNVPLQFFLWAWRWMMCASQRRVGYQAGAHLLVVKTQ